MTLRRLASLFISSAFTFSAFAAENTSTNEQDLVNNFAEIHQNLMAKVAVADMYFGCQLANQDTPQTSDSIETLILRTDKDTLGQQLIDCLGEDSIGSDKALNYGITGCFSDQTKHLAKQEQQQKMTQVAQAIESLDKTERQKSFTQCVNNQALQYLQIEK
ncbi:hypothetical protein FE810_08240 [Thalassotalea litorea]|uniref:Uncharacterized protein n=1 Tax=Thalassotalea litorea TaxID=2020715 RepID=A0A5R9IIB1_9GAMM|nr:hypothetical protein [Thalassotalea litorea]TLU65274.1 hypothetical protein FE810_08240 [Thalassotalea litorea]